MQCLSPIEVKVAPNSLLDPSQTSSLKSGFTFRLVPCGKCPACLNNRRLAWSFRFEAEAKRHPYNYFVTLTYSDEFVPPELSKEDATKFTKAMRNRLGSKFKIFLCGEYGEKFGRPHFHCCVFSDVQLSQEFFENVWRKGFVTLSLFLPARGSYVAKYSLKQIGYNYGDKQPPFSLASKGIGSNYVYGKSLNPLAPSPLLVANSSGYTIGLPRYYKRRILKGQNGIAFVRAQREQTFTWSQKISEKYVHLHKNYFGEMQAKKEHLVRISESKLMSKKLTDKIDK